MSSLVKIDNVRAESAFRKGLNDLTNIWPNIEAACKDAMDEVQPMLDRLDEDQNEQDAEYEKQMEKFIKYENDIKEWKRKGLCWLGNPEPEYVRRPFRGGLSVSLFKLHIRPRVEISSYEIIKLELIAKMNVANAAIGSYDVTHTYASEMVEWENGQKIKNILNSLEKSKENA